MHRSRVLLVGLKRHDALEAFPPARILAPFLFSALSLGARGRSWLPRQATEPHAITALSLCKPCASTASQSPALSLDPSC
jgi:hypothetical protein